MTLKPLQLRAVSYAQLRPTLESGDIALCRASSLEGQLIARVTHMQYSHASMLAWLNPHRRDTGGELMIVESVQHHGKRCTPFSKEVQAWPGYYDIFRPKAPLLTIYGREHYDGEAAAAWMARGSLSEYSYYDLVWAGAKRVWPWLRKVLPRPKNSDSPDYRRDCSCQCHAALRLHGGPVLRERDADCVPGDLATPRLFTYIGTACSTDAHAASFADQIHARTLQQRMSDWAAGSEPNSEHVEPVVLPFPEPRTTTLFQADTWTEESR